MLELDEVDVTVPFGVADLNRAFEWLRQQGLLATISCSPVRNPKPKENEWWKTLARNRGTLNGTS